ncbi:MAG: OmpA family protein [Planctomycetes bacterium]|nr:OmpA family protein [Planctomycetota bacterium]
MRSFRGLGVALLVAAGAGCVPLSDYRALERQFDEQEKFVVAHKDTVRELERREQAITLRAREQEQQLELLRGRLDKSETLRVRLEERLRAGEAPAHASVPASTPREEAPTVFGLEVNPETRGLVLESALLFPPGRWELKPEGRAAIDRVVAELNGPRYRDRSIRIDGHTDDAPIQRSRDKNQSNWELSAKRALAVIHYMEEKGIDPNRLSFAGFGPHSPFQKGSDDKARARNRRVEVVLIQ